MKNTIDSYTPSTIEEYISHIYKSTNTEESIDVFTAKSVALSHSLPKSFWTLDSATLFTTLLDLVKSGKISLLDIQYLASDKTILDGFRAHMLATMNTDMDTLKNRPKRAKPSITFDSLDSIIIDKLSVEM